MKAPALFAVCVAIWGTTWYAITLQLAATTPAVGVAMRFSIAAALIFAWCIARRKRLALTRSAHAWLATMGSLNFFASYLFVYYAEQHIVSGLVAVGYSAMPLVNMAMARAILGTRMSRKVALGGVLGIVGITLVFLPEFTRLAGHSGLTTGTTLTALAVLCSGLANIIVMRNQASGVDGWVPLAYAMAYGALATWIFALIIGDPLEIKWNWSFVASVIYLAAFGSALAFGAYFALLRKVGPARAAYVGVMATIIALLVSAVLEGYDWQLATFAGIALAIAGNVLALHGSVKSFA